MKILHTIVGIGLWAYPVVILITSAMPWAIVHSLMFWAILAMIVHSANKSTSASEVQTLREALTEAPIPEVESVYKDEEWSERYIDWWDKYEKLRLNTYDKLFDLESGDWTEIEERAEKSEFICLKCGSEVGYSEEGVMIHIQEEHPSIDLGGILKDES